MPYSISSASTCASSRYSSESNEERRERWKARKEERMRKKPKTNGMDVANHELVKAVLASNDNTADLAEALLDKDVPIADLEFVGAGSFARVFKSTWNRKDVCGGASITVVLKCIRGSKCRPYQSNGGTLHPTVWLEREMEANKLLHHPNIVQFYDAFVKKSPYLFVFEYCAGGSLHNVIHAKNELGKLSWPQCHKIACDIARGMSHLHTKRIIHRDLKPQNVLLVEPLTLESQTPQAKVGDFGLAKVLPEKDKHFTQDVESLIYMAPEVHALDASEDAGYDETVDVYSYAMIVYEMLACQLPFSHMTHGVRLVLFIVSGGRPELNSIPKDAPHVLQTLMEQSWDGCPEKRPAFEHMFGQLEEKNGGELKDTGSIEQLGVVNDCGLKTDYSGSIEQPGSIEQLVRG